jgi:hypothetical protein
LTDTADPFRISAKEVFAQMDKTECPLETYAEYYDPEMGDWTDARSGTYVEINMASGAKTVSLTYT